MKSELKNESRFNIDFMGMGKAFMIGSTLLTLASLILIMTKGFNYGIDFAGGSELQIKFSEPVETSKVRTFTEKNDMKNASVQAIGDNSEFLIRMDTVKGKDDKETNSILKGMMETLSSSLNQEFSAQSPSIVKMDTVGPQVGSELKRNGVLAAFYCMLVILIYIGLRFDYEYAPGAILCLLHDTLLTLGLYSLLDREVNAQTLAAVLTLIGYSLNDTIIVYDRVRENLRLYSDKPVDALINKSINDTLGRTLMTSLMTMISALCLYFFGDGVIKDFAFTFGLGVILGTYSSIYVAAPFVSYFSRIFNVKRA